MSISGCFWLAAAACATGVFVALLVGSVLPEGRPPARIDAPDPWDEYQRQMLRMFSREQAIQRASRYRIN